MMPPWSRWRWTQPCNTAIEPASVALNWPHVAVRFTCSLPPLRRGHSLGGVFLCDSGRNGNTWPHNRQIALPGRATGGRIGYDSPMRATRPKPLARTTPFPRGCGRNPDSHQGEAVGVYAHFPFCRHLCTYCDFDKFAGIERLIGPYSRRVVRAGAAIPPRQGREPLCGGRHPQPDVRGPPARPHWWRPAASGSGCRRKLRRP